MRQKGQLFPNGFPMIPASQFFFSPFHITPTLKKGSYSLSLWALYFFFFFLAVTLTASLPLKAMEKKSGLFTPDQNKPEEQLYYHSYYPQDSSPSKEAIVFIQGRNEFIEMYENVASSFLSSYKMDVHMFDLRGQGKSSGPRCHIDSFDQYLSDLEAFINDLKSRHGYENIHITAHSTGGLIATLFVAKHPQILGKNGTLSLGSPLYAINQSPTMQWLAWGLSNILSFNSWTSTFRAKGREECQFESNALTGHKGFFDKYVNHQQKCGPPTWGWLQATYAAINQLPQITDKIQTPLLVLTAGEDSVVRSEAAIKICKEINEHHPHLCQHEDYPGMKHILFHERERRKVLQRIRHFRQEVLDHNQSH